MDRLLRVLLLVAALPVVATFSTHAAGDGVPAGPSKGLSTPRNDTDRSARSFRRLAVSFEDNRGQARAAVDFIARGAGYTTYLASGNATFALHDPESSNISMSLHGGRRRSAAIGRSPLPGTVNHLVGNDPRAWVAGAATFGEVLYRDVYPGIDLLYHGRQDALEYDFIVSPGTNPSRILLEFTGADRIHIEGNGDLVLQSGKAELRHRKPVIYQEINGVRRLVPGGYVRRGARGVGFALGAYDRRQPLVIDPVLLYSSYLGGGSHDTALAVAVDAAGSVILTGQTDGLPANSAFGSAGNSNVFVTKLTPDGSSIAFTTILGGANHEWTRGLALGPDGSIYLHGSTDSPDFPVSAGAFDISYGGAGGDAFVVRLSAQGDALIYASYLGGSAGEAGIDIAVDAGGRAYVAGRTSSTDFPVAGQTPLQSALSTPAPGAPDYDSYVAAIDPIGSSLIFSTYLGGDGADGSEALALDAAGHVFVTGFTGSSNFPTTAGSLDVSYDGANDAFVAKLAVDGSSLVYSTLIGAAATEAAIGIALDNDGHAFVSGWTDSSGFPTTPGAFQPTKPAGTGRDAFVVKLNPAGTGLVYGTFLGGSADDLGMGIAVDGSGRAHVAGETYSSDFPLEQPIQPGHGGMADVFVARLDAAGSALTFSTYLGGESSESISGDMTCCLFRNVALDSVGNIYVVGATASVLFPTTPGAHDRSLDTTLPGRTDAFVVKIGDVPLPQAPVALAGGPYAVTLGAAVALDGRASIDPGGQALSYHWTLGDGTSATGATVSHTYVAAGVYTVELTVENTLGLSSTSSTVVTVHTPAGTVSAIEAQFDQLVAEGQVTEQAATELRAQLQVIAEMTTGMQFLGPDHGFASGQLISLNGTECLVLGAYCVPTVSAGGGGGSGVGGATGGMDCYYIYKFGLLCTGDGGGGGGGGGGSCFIFCGGGGGGGGFHYSVPDLGAAIEGLVQQLQFQVAIDGIDIGPAERILNDAFRLLATLANDPAMQLEILRYFVDSLQRIGVLSADQAGALNSLLDGARQAFRSFDLLKVHDFLESLEVDLGEPVGGQVLSFDGRELAREMIREFLKKYGIDTVYGSLATVGQRVAQLEATGGLPRGVSESINGKINRAMNLAAKGDAAAAEKLIAQVEQQVSSAPKLSTSDRSVLLALLSVARERL